MRKIWASYGCIAVTAVVAAVMLAVPVTAGSGEADRTVRVETAAVSKGTVERILALSGRVRYETEYGGAGLQPQGSWRRSTCSPASA